MNQDQLYAILKVFGPVIVTWLATKGVTVPDSITPAVVIGLVTLASSAWAAFSHSDKAKLIAAAALPHVSQIVVKTNAPPSSAAAEVAADPNQPKVTKTIVDPGKTGVTKS